MPTGKLHPDEISIDERLVHRLLVDQFPHWANLPVAPVPAMGTVNAMYRLGDDMVVRLPRIHWALDGLDRELRWLPWLAPRLPVTVPVLLAEGTPAEGYPWRWCVYRWLVGEPPEPGHLADPLRLGWDIAAFLLTLQRLDASKGPPSDQSLAARDAPVRAAINALRGSIDIDAVTVAWEADLCAPDWDGPPRWLHGDLAPGNMLVVDGRLSAVIDWSAVGVGDPAGDLRLVWSLLPAEVREDVRAALGVDDATWARGRGRTLAAALIQLASYHDKNPALAANARYAIQEILSTHRLVG